MGAPSHSRPAPSFWQRRGLAGVVAAMATLLLVPAAPAAADDLPRLPVDWAKLPLVLESPALLSHGARALLQDAPAGSRPGPHLSLVARDWEGSRQILGETVLLDELRPGRSSRMVVSRMHIVEGPIVAFAQVGAGEWRVDSTLFPTLPRERVVAGQGGLGFELSLSPQTVFAFEAESTFLHAHDASDVIAQTHPLLWGGSAAVRTRF